MTQKTVTYSNIFVPKGTIYELFYKAYDHSIDPDYELTRLKKIMNNCDDVIDRGTCNRLILTDPLYGGLYVKEYLTQCELLFKLLIPQHRQIFYHNEIHTIISPQREFWYEPLKKRWAIESMSSSISFSVPDHIRLCCEKLIVGGTFKFIQNKYARHTKQTLNNIKYMEQIGAHTWVRRAKPDIPKERRFLGAMQ